MRHYLVTLVAGSIAGLLAGCASAPIKQSAPAPEPLLYLSEEVLAANSDSALSLYKAWITPARIKGLSFTGRAEVAANEAAVLEGVRRFCERLGAVFTTERGRFGAQHSCNDRQGTFIAQFEVLRYDGDVLGITLETPESRNEKAAQMQAFETQKALNGPMGRLYTDAGEFRFVRIGTLKNRHVVVLEDNERKEKVPIDNFSRIDFRKIGENVTTSQDGGQYKRTIGETLATLQNGSQYKTNITQLVKEYVPGGLYYYGNGVPFVVIDPDSGQPYTRRFMPFSNLKSIVIDPPGSGWKNQPATLIESKLDLFSQAAIDRFTQVLRERAQRRLVEAERNGWMRRLPDGRLTPELMKYLEDQLKRLTDDWDCKGDLVGDQHDGIESLEDARQCKVAEHELETVVRSAPYGAGARLSTKGTPLSMLIIIALLQKDVQ